MSSTNYFKSLYFLPLLFAIACTNPAGSEEEHQDEIHGVVLEVNGEEIVRAEDGVVSSGQIDVAEGSESPTITIYFLDEEGHKFHPEEPHFELDWEVGDISIAQVVQKTTHEKWNFHVVGKSRGSTSVVFSLWHTSEEHNDFETPSITINVN